MTDGRIKQLGYQRIIYMGPTLVGVIITRATRPLAKPANAAWNGALAHCTLVDGWMDGLDGWFVLFAPLHSPCAHVSSLCCMRHAAPHMHAVGLVHCTPHHCTQGPAACLFPVLPPPLLLLKSDFLQVQFGHFTCLPATTCHLH